MIKRMIPVLALVLIIGSAAGFSLAESTVQIFFVACPNQAVMNLTGQMDAGYDVYYQVFSGAAGTGNTLTSLRRAQVDGDFKFSETIPYTSGEVAAGQIASARVTIAREGNPSSTTFVTTVDDVQDGCNAPQNPTGTSVDAGAGAAAVTTSSGSGILSPFGGTINPNISVTPEPIVVLGPRTTVNPLRSATPGIIFAECDQYLPGAAPGLLYDNDNIVIFWSWFARTEAQVQDHLAKAQYSVKLNRAPLVEVQVSPIERRSTNYWVFYTANIGRLRPGSYGVEFRLTWSEAISDGYDAYGPDTDNPEMVSTCTFRIDPNPTNERVTNYSLMYSVR